MGVLLIIVREQELTETVPGKWVLWPGTSKLEKSKFFYLKRPQKIWVSTASDYLQSSNYTTFEFQSVKANFNINSSTIASFFCTTLCLY